MGKNVDNLNLKSRLVKEICAASAGCVHRSGASQDGFIDWYHLLRGFKLCGLGNVWQVYEDADIDVIRKQYFKFALQLHPDKNSHPNAEIAFKLISQAYTCLSDDSKRKSFDLDRLKNSCLICNKSVKKSGSNSVSVERSKSSRLWRGWRERFKAEASVIENCLKSNANVPKKEYPVFSPSGGSMLRSYFGCERGAKESPVYNPPSEESYMERMRWNKSWYSENRNQLSRRMQETPVFEVKHEMSRLYRSKSAACVHPLRKETKIT